MNTLKEYAKEAERSMTTYPKNCDENGYVISAEEHKERRI